MTVCALSFQQHLISVGYFSATECSSSCVAQFKAIVRLRSKSICLKTKTSQVYPRPKLSRRTVLVLLEGKFTFKRYLRVALSASFSVGAR